MDIYSETSYTLVSYIPSNKKEDSRVSKLQYPREIHWKSE